MKLSCTPISLARLFKQGEMDLRGFIDFCAQEGCEAIDLLDPARYDWLWQDVAGESKQVGKWLESAGLQLAAYGCGNNFAKRDSGERASQIEAVQKTIRHASKLGAPCVRIFGGHVARGQNDDGVDSPTGMGYVLEGIDQCLPLAEQKGIVLALENHGGLPGNAFELAGVIRHFESPHLRCTFDCANFIGNNMPEPEDPLRAFEHLSAHIAFVHVKDFAPHPDPASGRRVIATVAGEGDVPLRQLTALLEMSGYDGFYSLEYEAGESVPEREGASQSFAYLRQLKALHEVLHLQPTLSSP